MRRGLALLLLVAIGMGQVAAQGQDETTEYRLSIQVADGRISVSSERKGIAFFVRSERQSSDNLVSLPLPRQYRGVRIKKLTQRGVVTVYLENKEANRPENGEVVVVGVGSDVNPIDMDPP